jgi:hypothetical protein
MSTILATDKSEFAGLTISKSKLGSMSPKYAPTDGVILKSE